MNIEPTYVTFQQAKLLKEKGFDIYTPNAYINGIFITPEEPQNWNKTKWVFTKEGFECFGCKLDNIKYFEGFCAPEQWIVIEWLLLNRRIDIIIKYPESNTNKVEGINSVYYDLEIYRLSGGDAHKLYKFIEVSDKKQKAYSAAIDYVLTTLI